MQNGKISDLGLHICVITEAVKSGLKQKVLSVIITE